ncbi:DNA repair protein [Gemmatirosa kalamazoonensis]|uniref:Non-homologous end joining protein Ku n=1 Tax=Gemmatirosa kalamazoonensis TaxID=861299 RepID=W0RBF7_9BACT|nr:Ku protein [Gemmatirosa kalamazoonensis]AHG88136.1 DNA repair protein [Gemmatirosa kalamazoonensis]
MATIWKGALTFGLVNIPVELRPAVRADHVSFRLLHAADLTPVKFERVSRKTGKPVPWREIVKGYEYAKGKYVVLTDEDFKAIALESSKTIDILDFVQATEIDPRYFETPYYLVPGKGGEKAYALLREAVRKAGAVGIGKIVMRQTQHLAGVKVVGDALVLEIMRFATELVDADEYTFPAANLVRPQELAMAEQLVANLAEPFDPGKYTDEYRASLMKVIKAKMAGKKIVAPAEDERAGDADVLDLMSRLQASLAKKPAKGRAAAAKKGAAPARPRRRKSA